MERRKYIISLHDSRHTRNQLPRMAKNALQHGAQSMI